MFFFLFCILSIRGPVFSSAAIRANIPLREYLTPARICQANFANALLIRVENFQ